MRNKSAFCRAHQNLTKSLYRTGTFSQREIDAERTLKLDNPNKRNLHQLV